MHLESHTLPFISFTNPVDVLYTQYKLQIISIFCSFRDPPPPPLYPLTVPQKYLTTDQMPCFLPKEMARGSHASLNLFYLISAGLYKLCIHINLPTMQNPHTPSTQSHKCVTVFSAPKAFSPPRAASWGFLSFSLPSVHVLHKL
jgi:hypothetical protein